MNENEQSLKGWTIPVLDHGYVRLIDWMGDDQRIVEFARVSYKSPSKGIEQDTRLLHYLYKNKHTSPFEAVKISLNIKMPIFVMRQYIRHRMQNLNEMSARYTELPSEFYIPEEWRKQDVKNKQGSVEEGNFNPPVTLMESWDEFGNRDMFTMDTATDAVREFCTRSYHLYQQLLFQGIAREMARMILPLNIYTEFYCCWDLKNLMHFLQLREDSHAQWEIQQYAKAMKKIASKLFPITIEAFDKYKWKIEEI